MEYTVIVRKAPDGFYIASCPLVPEAQAQDETYLRAGIPYSRGWNGFLAGKRQG